MRRRAGAIDRTDEDVGSFVLEDVFEAVAEGPLRWVSGTRIFGPDPALLAAGRSHGRLCLLVRFLCFVEMAFTVFFPFDMRFPRDMNIWS